MNSYRFWTTSEIIILKAGIIPSGRSVRACRAFCRRMGVVFEGKRRVDENLRLIKEKDSIHNNKENT